jgi:beta-N-acetylhexosaminidase
VRVSGPRRTLDRPVIIEIEPRENIAAGRFGWGLGPWAPPGSVHRVGPSGRPVNGTETGPGGNAEPGPGGNVEPEGAGVAGILAAAAGRSLVVAVRDAHRDQQTRALVGALLAARPDLVLVEMGLPFWHPPEGTSYLATYGASRASATAAAELLGLV